MTDYLTLKDGTRYYLDPLIDTVFQVREEYRFQDIKKTDTVVDIGACIGGFSILASGMCRQVYAIEPVTPERVSRNAKLNNIDNITVMDEALGDGGPTEIKWAGMSKSIHTKKMVDLLQGIKSCDFLKIDCEGPEWSLESADFGKFRRIEMEVHDIGRPVAEMKKRLEDAGFHTAVDSTGGTFGKWIVHASKEPMAQA